MYKKLVINLPKLMRHDCINNFMFGYVLALRSMMPSITVNKSIELFMDEFGLSEDDYSLDSARVRYYEMLKEFQEEHSNF